MSRPLDGITIVDTSKVVAGPFCTMLLADMGADVIKVEVPGYGDDFRHAIPIVDGESYHFLLLNRNKRSVTVNLKTKEGKGVLYDLVKGADVFVENYKFGKAKELGVDYQTLSGVNAGLVYCSISGFGQTGPMNSYPAYDLIAQAMSGILGISGIDGKPVASGISLTDFLSGLYAAYGILSALIARSKTGKGQYVDVSLFESGIAVLGQLAAVYLGTNRIPKAGDKYKTIVPYGIFETKDRSVVIEAASNATWRRLCEALGYADWLKDERFDQPPKRVGLHDQIIERITKTLREESAEHWLKLFHDHEVPAGPVLDLQEVFLHGQTLSRGMVKTVHHRRLGDIRLIGPAVKLSLTPAAVDRAPPLLGEHTEEVLRSIGYTRDRIDKLKESGAI